MKKYLSFFVVLMVIAPSVAFASWWNPFSWKIFQRNTPITQISTEVAISSDANIANNSSSTTAPLSSTSTTPTDAPDMVLCNGQYYEKCEVGQLLVCPTDAKVEAYCSIPKIPKVKSVTEVPPAPKPKSATVAPPTKPAVETSSPVLIAPSLDYKPQILDLLIAAKKNYVESIQYADECASVAIKRKADVERFILSGRTETLSTMADDEYLTRIFTKYWFGGGDAEVSLMEKHRIYCGVTIRTILSNNINLLDNEMLKIKNFSRPLTSEELASYQVAYFGPTNSTANDRSNIKKTIEQMSSEISGYNTLYSLALSKMDEYVSGILATTNSQSSYVIPPLPALPQMPKTTSCTISGDGGVGLQAYVNCTSY